MATPVHEKSKAGLMKQELPKIHAYDIRPCRDPGKGMLDCSCETWFDEIVIASNLDNH